MFIRSRKPAVVAILRQHWSRSRDDEWRIGCRCGQREGFAGNREARGRRLPALLVSGSGTPRLRGRHETFVEHRQLSNRGDKVRRDWNRGGWNCGTGNRQCHGDGPQESLRSTAPGAASEGSGAGLYPAALCGPSSVGPVESCVGSIIAAVNGRVSGSFFSALGGAAQSAPARPPGGDEGCALNSGPTLAIRVLPNSGKPSFEVLGMRSWK